MIWVYLFGKYTHNLQENDTCDLCLRDESSIGLFVSVETGVMWTTRDFQ